MLGGLISLIVLILDVWAILKIAQSGASTGSKTLWIVLVLILPVAGFIIWFLAGPKSR